MLFEWDENKNQSNKLKHDIDFWDAVNIFYDESRMVTIDQRQDYKEIRYRTIGIVDHRMLAVVYTVRDDHYRIISARRASKDEREDYYSQEI